MTSVICSDNDRRMTEDVTQPARGERMFYLVITVVRNYFHDRRDATCASNAANDVKPGVVFPSEQLQTLF